MTKMAWRFLRELFVVVLTIYEPAKRRFLQIEILC